MGAAEDFKRGIALFQEDKHFDALNLIERAHNQDPRNPAYASYFALLHALERGLTQEAVGISWQAISRSPGEADYYFNLGQVYLKGGQKADAISTLRAGLGLDPQHPGILALMASLGVRRSPVFNSLPRSHFLNRFIGWWVARLASRKSNVTT